MDIDEQHRMIAVRIGSYAGDDQVQHSKEKKDRWMVGHTWRSVKGHRRFGFSLDHSNLDFVWGQRLVERVEESESVGIRQ